MSDDTKKLVEDACDGDTECIAYLYANCPELKATFPSQMDYYLTGRESLVEYARRFKEQKEQDSNNNDE